MSDATTAESLGESWSNEAPCKEELDLLEKSKDLVLPSWLVRQVLLQARPGGWSATAGKDNLSRWARATLSVAVQRTLELDEHHCATGDGAEHGLPEAAGGLSAVGLRQAWRYKQDEEEAVQLVECSVWRLVQLERS